MPLFPSRRWFLPERRRSCASCALPLLLVATGLFAAPAADAADKYDLAARITHLLGKYSTWPPNASRGEFVLVGVYDGGPAAGAFASLKGESLNGGRIRVVGINANTPANDISQCAIVFTSDAADLKRAANATRGAPVLLVHLGRDEGLACVSLFETGGRLAFEVHMAALRQRNLKMSSQALKLAANVHQ